VIIALVALVVIASITTLIVVLANKDRGGHSTGDSGTQANPDAPATAQASSVEAPPGPPPKPFEQVALDYVSAVQNKDQASARDLACASYQTQVTVEPELRSPEGVTVTEIDTYRLSGSSAITNSDAPETVLKANVGVVVTGGEQSVLWVLKLQPEGGSLHVCGQTVLGERELVPSA
jgi:hypothetical protein